MDVSGACIIYIYILTYIHTYIYIYHISLYHCFYIHVFPRPFEVILASGFTLCYCAMAVQQLPLQESFSLSIGATGFILMIWGPWYCAYSAYSEDIMIYCVSLWNKQGGLFFEWCFFWGGFVFQPGFVAFVTFVGVWLLWLYHALPIYLSI